MELNQMLNKIYVGIDFTRNDKVNELFVLNESSIVLYRYQAFKDSAQNCINEICKLSKNKEVVTFSTSVNHLFDHITSNIKTETFIQSRIIEFFCEYDFLTNENGIVEHHHTKNIHKVLDIFSQIFNQDFEPIYITEFDEKAKYWKKEYFENKAFFEAFYLIRLYKYLYDMQDKEKPFISKKNS